MVITRSATFFPSTTDFTRLTTSFRPRSRFSISVAMVLMIP